VRSVFERRQRDSRGAAKRSARATPSRRARLCRRHIATRVATERRTDADARELARARDGDDAGARSVRARVALGARAEKGVRASEATRRCER
jgi:hypothetical protein